MLRHLCAALLAIAALAAPPAPAQDPLERYSDAFEAQFDSSQPVLHYTVRVDPRDRSGYSVELRVRGAGDTLRLAMPVWAPGAYRVVTFARDVRDLIVLAAGRRATVVREDSSRWRAVVRGGEATVRYRVTYRSAVAASSPNNRAFLRETGGLLDGPATFIYLAGWKLVPAHVTFDVPADWRIATGLEPTADTRVFFAPSYDVLIDSPVLLGALRVWRFDVDGVPHRVAYWPSPDATPFDTAAFVRSVEQVTREAIRVFGRPPYREYTFLYVDGTGGGLEHLNSSTMGAPSARLATDPISRASLTAHEFFHAWNVKRIRPAALGPFDYQRPVRTTELWWSEGVTDYYADAIMRRSGLVDERRARETLAGNIASYLGNPAHTRISPERSSWTTWDTPAVHGGYSISYYLQGALLGELLDIAIRDSTGMRRGMDDVMRAMLERYAAERGFTGEDILHTVNDVCGCDLQLFFERHVSGAEEMEFNRYLASLGLRAVVERGPATDSAGRPLPDLRLGVRPFGGVGSAGGAAGSRPRLSVPDPTSAWGRAGLMSGDELVAVNGRPVASPNELRAALNGAGVGGRIRVDFVRGGETRRAEVVLTGYEETRVRLEELPNPSVRQRAMRAAWLRGRPIEGQGSRYRTRLPHRSRWQG